MQTSSLDLAPMGSLIDGKWLSSEKFFKVEDKFTGHQIAQISEASREQVAQAVRVARRGADGTGLTPFERAKVLRRAAELVQAKRQRFIEIIIAEAGFILSDASLEVDRAVITLNLSAEEATRLTGQMVPFAGSPGAHNRIGFTMRLPIGVVCAITPFNSPLNTVVHKIAPAFAAGNSVILKPSALTPLSGAFLAEILLEAGMPPEFISVVQGAGETVGSWLLQEQDISFYTFTGSTPVGRVIQHAAGLRRTQMELGSIASTIVCADANLDKAIEKIGAAAFRKAGQVCTSVQRLYVDQKIISQVKERLIHAASNLRAGDPRDPLTNIGPLISEHAAVRVENWTNEARMSGAQVVCGGERKRSVISPMVIEAVPEEAQIWSKEAFAPLLVLRPFSHLNEAMLSANSTPFGLSAGIFTQDIDRALQAARTLRFGTVYINETSSARSDVMPFGGVKDSGFGKEGPSYAIKEMTEERLVVFSP